MNDPTQSSSIVRSVVARVLPIAALALLVIWLIEFQMAQRNARRLAERQVQAEATHLAGLVRERVELLPTAVVDGDIKTPRVLIAEGSIFEGSCEMDTAPAAATAKGKK